MSFSLKIKKIHEKAIIPEAHSNGAACFDLSILPKGKLIMNEWIDGSFEHHILFSTGMIFEIEPGYAIHLYERSSTYKKTGIELVNKVGIIDSDYRGEILVQCKTNTPALGGPKILQYIDIHNGKIPKQDEEIRNQREFLYNYIISTYINRIYGDKFIPNYTVSDSIINILNSDVQITKMGIHEHGSAFADFDLSNVLEPQRLFQFSLEKVIPLYHLEVVDELSSTERGSGGFGSTDQKDTTK